MMPERWRNLFSSATAARWQQQVLLRLGAAWFDGVRKSLHSGERDQHSNAGRILIVGRAHYFELHRTYPVGTKRELQGAVELDMPDLSPWPDSIGLWHIASAQPGRMRVNIWFIQRRVLEASGVKPWLILPEGLLYALSGGPALRRIQSDNGDWYWYRDAHGVVTSQPATGLYRNAEVFTRLTPYDAQDLVEQPPVDCAEQLRAGLGQLRPAMLPGFWVASPGEWINPTEIRRLAVIAGIAVLVYLAGTSAWLVQRESALEQEVAQTRERVDHHMQQEAALEQQVARYRQLHKPLANPSGIATMVGLLPELIDAETDLSELSYTGQRVQLAVTTPSATALLSRVNAHQWISSASLSGGVRSAGRNDDRDRATLVIDWPGPPQEAPGNGH